MEAIFKNFREAHIAGNGYQLSDTLLPISPSEEPRRLRDFYNSTNAANVKGDIQYNVLYDRQSTLRLSTEEGKAWVDVYTAYWAAVGEIIKAEDAQKTNSQVRVFSSFPGPKFPFRRQKSDHVVLHTPCTPRNWF
jgi:hypothetical protein